MGGTGPSSGQLSSPPAHCVPLHTAPEDDASQRCMNWRVRGGWKNKEEGGRRVSATQRELRNKRDRGTGNIPAVWQRLVRCRRTSRSAQELPLERRAPAPLENCSASESELISGITHAPRRWKVPRLTHVYLRSTPLYSSSHGFLLVFSYCDISLPPCQLVPGPDACARGHARTRTDSSCADDSLAWWNG